jgi:hypothetical protein
VFARHLRTPAPAVTPIVARRIAEIRAAPAPAAPRQPAAGNGQSERGGELTGTQRRILDVTHELVRRGLQPNREMIARWLGIHPNGGRYLRDLARLRADGLLEGCLPTAGSDGLARSLQPGLSGVLEGIDGTKQKILDALIAADAPISREQLASALGIHPNGGRFLADLAWLRTMGVITERSPIATTSALFA